MRQITNPMNGGGNHDRGVETVPPADFPLVERKTTPQFTQVDDLLDLLFLLALLHPILAHTLVIYNNPHPNTRPAHLKKTLQMSRVPIREARKALLELQIMQNDLMKQLVLPDQKMVLEAIKTQTQKLDALLFQMLQDHVDIDLTRSCSDERN